MSSQRPLAADLPSQASDHEFERLLSIASALQSFQNLRGTGWVPETNSKATQVTSSQRTEPKKAD